MNSKEHITQFEDKVKRKSYLIDILVSSFTEKATATASLMEKLVKKAISYGRSQKEAEDDVQSIMNLNAAIDTLVGKVVDDECASIDA